MNNTLNYKLYEKLSEELWIYFYDTYNSQIRYPLRLEIDDQLHEEMYVRFGQDFGFLFHEELNE